MTTEVLRRCLICGWSTPGDVNMRRPAPEFMAHWDSHTYDEQTAVMVRYGLSR